MFHDQQQWQYCRAFNKIAGMHLAIIVHQWPSGCTSGINNNDNISGSSGNSNISGSRGNGQWKRARQILNYSTFSSFCSRPPLAPRLFILVSLFSVGQHNWKIFTLCRCKCLSCFLCTEFKMPTQGTVTIWKPGRRAISGGVHQDELFQVALMIPEWSAPTLNS